MGALVHGLVLLENLDNPFARQPVVDAAYYWDWAGHLASGKLIGSEPFFAAPLYPYLLGVLRAVGGGLVTLYVLQLLLHLATAALLARLGRRTFGRGVGLGAAALWLLAMGPAAAHGRVLAGTLQTFLVTLTLDRASVLAEGPDVRRGVSLGLCAGLACLAYPPLLAALPVFALWCFAAAKGRARVRIAGSMLAAGALTVLPATAHNLAACGELIPISAHAGLTFYHGNNPNADGTYSAQEVSDNKITQGWDAREQTRAVHGPEAGWRQTSSHFFAKGVEWWRAEPGRALGLMVEKGWWFLSGRVYGDMYIPSLERDGGIAGRLALTPLPVAWLVLPALIAALLLLREEPRRHLPSLLLILVPLAICVVFWYTPRYRLPAVPVMALLGAWSLARIVRWRAAPVRAALLAAGCLVAVASGAVNRSLGFDRPSTYQAEFEMHLAELHHQLGEEELAREHTLAAHELGHPQAAVQLANLAREGGDHVRALEILKQLAGARPQDPFAQKSYAVALVESGRPDLARPVFERALALDKGDYQARSGLGGTLLALGRASEAITHFEAALEIYPESPDVHYNLGLALAASDRPDEAVAAWRAELARDPDHDGSRRQLIQTALDDARWQDAVGELEALLERQPEHRGARSWLAWTLATCPDDGVRDGARALSLATALERETEGRDPEVLDTLAAALAETGDWPRAVEAAECSAQVWRGLGGEEQAAEVEARAAGYRAQQAFRQVP